MNFDDLDEVLDKLGPIEMWEEDHGKKKRVISHCRERFDLGVPTNGEEAMVTSELLVAKAIMETMEMKSDLEKKRRGAILEIPEEKWTAMEKAASQFESDVLVNSRERGIGKYIDLSATGMRLKYARFGAEGCDKVVFILHDTGENGESYYGLAKQIQEKGGFTVYCVDFRGHGDSTHSREGQYDVPSFVADIESFIVELDLYAHPVALVGFGLGAIIAAAFAGEHEHLVAGLTLIESHPKCREDAVAFHRFQNVIFGSLREAVTFEIALNRPTLYPAATQSYDSEVNSAARPKRAETDPRLDKTDSQISRPRRRKISSNLTFRYRKFYYILRTRRDRWQTHGLRCTRRRYPFSLDRQIRPRILIKRTEHFLFPTAQLRLSQLTHRQ